MVEQGLEFHNVDHLEQVPGMNGLLLERFPAHLRENLGIPENKNGRFQVRRSHGCEIRFVTNAPYFDFCVTAVETNVTAMVYYGDMAYSQYTLEAGVCTRIHVTYPEMYRQVDTELISRGRFAPYIWRIQFGLGGSIYFHYLDTFGHDRRPPTAEEKPAILWAAYGSSITCGSVAALYSNSYIEQAALHLGYDVMNKGLSGSCLCEEKVADYLASLQVDVLSVELGVNMLLFFEEDEFRRRVQYLLRKVKESSVAKNIYVMDIFYNRAPVLLDHENIQYRHYEPFRKIVKNLVQETADHRIISVDANAIAADATYLSVDLLHPSDQGHIRMGWNLAEWIRKHG
ncbi:MAG: hypothetical protein HFH93_13395 [Lachnospiraceae bacterium]|nr:hypothetical protein [Lachnospiraceae bacterium]